MTWGNSSNISTTNLDSATDSPALARLDLLAALGELQNVINGLGTTGGALKIESDDKIFGREGIKTATSKNLNLQPNTSMVKIENFINLKPVAYASLPSTPAQGDVAFLTTDGASATKNKLCYYNGTAWKYFNDDSTVAAS
jgi:hypothetical protein